MRRKISDNIEVMFQIKVILFFTLFWCVAQAQENREFYNGVRSLGMGGVRVATVNDETALLINPSALGKLRELYGTIIDPEVEGTSNLSTFYNNSRFSNPFDLNQVKSATDAAREKRFFSQLTLFPSLVIRNFGFGIYYRQLMDAQMSADGLTLKTYALDDLALVAGINVPLWDGRIKIGAAGRAVSRIQIDGDLDPNASIERKDVASEGFGTAIDAGITLTAPWTYLPTLAATVRDIGGTSYGQRTGVRLSTATQPASVDQDIDVALAIFPIHSSNKRSAFSVEYKNIKKASESSDKQKFMHVGYEFNFGDRLFLRAGMNQRYWTAGIELASQFTQLQLASYGEDVGTSGSPEEERRMVLKWAFRF